MWSQRRNTNSRLRWSKKQWKVEIEISSQNYMIPLKQQKTKIKNKFWALSTLTKSKEKSESPEWMVRKLGEETGKKHFQEGESGQQLHKHGKVYKMRTQMKLEFCFRSLMILVMVVSTEFSHQFLPFQLLHASSGSHYLLPKILSGFLTSSFSLPHPSSYTTLPNQS